MSQVDNSSLSTLKDLLSRNVESQDFLKRLDWAIDYMSERSNTMFTGQLPTQLDTTCINLFSPKMSALIYDRVWPSNPFAECPIELRFWGGTETEFRAAVAVGLELVILEARDEDREGGQLGTDEDDVRASHVIYQWAWPGFPESIFKTLEPGKFLYFNSGAIHTYRIMQALSESSSSNIVPVYSSASSRDLVHRTGDRSVLIFALSKLPVVNEKTITWEQVLEFRKDGDAKKKLRRLIHWMDSDMTGKTAHAVVDAIAVRLEEYEWALRKHGIETVIGEVEGMLDPTFLAGTTLTAGGIALLTEPLLGLAAQGAIVAGRVAIRVSRHLLRREEIRRSSEVAWVYDLKKAVAE